MSITINRIKAVWEKHGVLDKSQHDFRGERGTDSALLSIINELEKRALNTPPDSSAHTTVNEPLIALARTLRR